MVDLVLYAFTRLRLLRLRGSLPLRYMRQLDGLRALAVSMVFVHHFVSGRFQLGTFGVLLFFVISGFLITGILFELKELVSEGTFSIGKALKYFYARRFLRIFPLYYLAIAGLCLLNLPTVRHQILWYLLYGTNMRSALDHVYPPATGHFWSLAVEEQFYVIWPMIILLTPRRHLRTLMWSLIFASSSFRAVGKIVFHLSPIATNSLTIGCLDYFSIGALLALKNPKDKAFLRRAGLICIPIVVLETALLFVGRATKLSWASFELCCALSAALVVSYAADGMDNAFGRFLSWRPLLYLGMISYGLYVYHLPIYELAWKQPILSTLLTIGVASISWYFYEKPINSLKRHFEYPRRSKVESSPLKARDEFATAAVPLSGVV